MKLQYENYVLQREGFECVIVLPCGHYQNALIGVTDDNIAVYDFEKMVAWLVDEYGWSEDEAIDWIYYNVIPSLSKPGSRYPIIMHPINGGESR